MTGRKSLVTISFLIILVLLSVSCNPDTTPTPTATPAPTTAASPAVTAEAHWWDDFGEPEYGGTYTMRTEMIDIITEPQDPRSSQFASWFEVLFSDDWTTDRSEYSFKSSFTPVQYRQGWLAESWEQTDATTVTVKIREGIYWQDKSPTYGREFTAEDVQYSYNRILATGEFTGKDPNPFYVSLIPSVKDVVATDKYTVEFILKAPSAMAIYDVVEPFLSICMVPREWVELTPEEQQDWHNVTGTGAFILTEYEANVSLVAEANPDYWAYDERYPENKLPYFDAVKAVVIPDISTAIAALKTSKVDIISDDQTSPSIAQAQALAESNPEILQFNQPTVGTNLYMRVDAAPFDDVRVRTAMQMAINVPSIAADYYKGYALGEPTGLLSPLIGEDWSVPYEDWPEDLKAEYTYDVAGARQLLAEAGYPDGFEVNLLSSTSDATDVQQIMKSYFSDIGVTMNINSYEKQQRDSMLKTGEYEEEMTGGGWVGPGSMSTPGTALGAYWSEKMERPGGPLGPYDSTYDAYVNNFGIATTMEEAQAIFKEADRYSLQQHWVVQAGPVYTIKVCQPWLKGYSGETFWSANGWFFRTRMWIDSSLKE